MKKRKKVLLTSAGIATAANVISALRKSSAYDCFIVAVDMDPHAAGLYLADEGHLVPASSSADYFVKIKGIIQKHGIDFVFPLYSKEIALFSEHASYIKEAGADVLIAEKATIDLCNDKRKFLSFLGEHGFGFPTTYESPEDVERFPVFLRPVSGSSSTNTFKISDREEMMFYFKRYPQAIIQEFISQKEFTVDCLIDRNKRVLACVPRERVKVKDGKSVVAKTVKDDRIIRQVLAMIGELGIIGPCNVQLFFDGERAIFVEVNPRLAAGGLPLSVEAGINIPELMLHLSDGEQIEYQDFTDGLILIRYLADVFLKNGNQKI